MSTRTWEGKSAFNFQVAKAMDCCRDRETASDRCDFGYCFSGPFSSGVRGDATLSWKCVCPVQVLGRSSLPSSGVLPSLLDSPFHDFTSSQSWSVESSTSDSPTSIAIISEMSESLLTAGSCSPGRRKQSSW